MGPQHLTQRSMKQVRPGVIASSSGTNLAVHHSIDSIANDNRLFRHNPVCKYTLHRLRTSSHIGNNNIVISREQPAHIAHLTGTGVVESERLADFSLDLDAVGSVLLIGHNPGLHDLALMLASSGVERDRLELMSSLDASRWQVFWLVKLPTSLPLIFAGLNLGIVYALLGALVAEFIGAQRGMGVMVLQLQSVNDTAGVFAVLIVLAVVGYVLITAVRMIQRRVVFWSGGSTGNDVI